MTSESYGGVFSLGNDYTDIEYTWEIDNPNYITSMTIHDCDFKNITAGTSAETDKSGGFGLYLIFSKKSQHLNVSISHNSVI